jgi:hypothetical protein
MAFERAVIDAPSAAARGSRAVDAAPRLPAIEVAGVEIATDALFARAVPRLVVA